MIGISKHQEALEAAFETFKPHQFGTLPYKRQGLEAAISTYLSTLAPADNGLVERYSMSIQGPFDRDPPGLEPDNDGDWVTYSDYKVLLSDRTAQAAEIDRLKAERDEHRDMRMKLFTELAQEKARLSALEALLDKAVETLGPFVFGDSTIADILWGDLPDEASMNMTLPLGTYRAARSTLTAIQEARHAGN